MAAAVGVMAAAGAAPAGAALLLQAAVPMIVVVKTGRTAAALMQKTASETETKKVIKTATEGKTNDEPHKRTRSDSNRR